MVTMLKATGAYKQCSANIMCELAFSNEKTVPSFLI